MIAPAGPDEPHDIGIEASAEDASPGCGAKGPALVLTPAVASPLERYVTEEGHLTEEGRTLNLRKNHGLTVAERMLKDDMLRQVYFLGGGRLSHFSAETGLAMKESSTQVRRLFSGSSMSPFQIPPAGAPIPDATKVSTSVSFQYSPSGDLHMLSEKFVEGSLLATERLIDRLSSPEPVEPRDLIRAIDALTRLTAVIRGMILSTATKTDASRMNGMSERDGEKVGQLQSKLERLVTGMGMAG